MGSLKLHLVVILCLSNVWTIVFATDCSDQHFEKNGRCCELCPPGKYVEEVCTQNRSTVCSPCDDGFYSKNTDRWEKCHQCHICQHEYVRKCTPTTDAKCSCSPGFLCSDHMCTKCEQTKCRQGEELKLTGFREYSYKCEPCPDNTYSDTDEGICKTLTKCNASGRITIFHGNKTHNSVCGYSVQVSKAGEKKEGGSILLPIGFIVFAFSLLMILVFACMKIIGNRERKAKNHHPDTSDYHLSKEESGGRLVQLDEPKEILVENDSGAHQQFEALTSSVCSNHILQ